MDRQNRKQKPAASEAPFAAQFPASQSAEIQHKAQGVSTDDHSDNANDDVHPHVTHCIIEVLIGTLLRVRAVGIARRALRRACDRERSGGVRTRARACGRRGSSRLTGTRHKTICFGRWVKKSQGCRLCTSCSFERRCSRRSIRSRRNRSKKRGKRCLEGWGSGWWQGQEGQRWGRRRWEVTLK